MLNDKQKDTLKGYLFNREMSNFGPTTVEHFIRKGFPEWKGLDNMSDEELLEETGCSSFEQFEAMLEQQKKDWP